MKYLVLPLLLIFACKSTQVVQGENEDFVIAFGSCNHQWDPQTIWPEVISNDPDLWVWTGDIVYADTKDMDKLNRDYSMLKSNANYQDLLVQCPVVGIWDDHDYGSNNDGKDYEMKDESKKALFKFLDVAEGNSAYSRSGAYQSYNYAIEGLDVKLILLDVRYFRDTLGTPDGTILGEEQWKWFEEELESGADINLIAGGIQFLHKEHKYEKWFNFPSEYNRLLNLLSRTNVSNPILISGDRHIGEIASLDLTNGNVVYDITSSGLTHSYEKSTETNSLRIGPLIRTINFGVMRISKKELSLELHNSSNQIVSHHTISLN